MKSKTLMLLIIALAAAPAHAEGVRIGVPHAHADADIAAAIALARPEDIVLSGSEACVTEVACLDALRNGALDVVATSPQTVWSILPASAAFDLPHFLTADEARIRLGRLPRMVAGQLEVIAATPSGTRRVIATASRRITHPDDMAGLRFYAPDLASDLLVIAAGGDVVDLPRSAVFDALQVGDLDGVILDISELMRSDLVMAGASYATVADHAIDIRLWWARTEWLEQLSTERRAAFADARHAGFLAALQAADRRNAEAFEDFSDAGGDLYSLSDEGRSAFLALMAPYHDAMRRQFPQAGPVDDVLMGR